MTLQNKIDVGLKWILCVCIRGGPYWPLHCNPQCFKMDLREIGWDGVDWIDMAQDRDQWRALVSTVMNLQVP
jgi:hypothetical protein